MNGEGPRIFLIGEDGLREELKILRPSYLAPSDRERSDFVVVGLDREINYQKICKASRDIMEGALFIGVNGDNLWPVEEGFMPGVGIFLSALQSATGKPPLIVGKPNTYMLEMAIKRYRCSPGEGLVVGDKLDSDVLMGKKLGAKTALVLSGVTTEEEVKESPLEMKPDFVVKDLAHLCETLFHST